MNYLLSKLDNIRIGKKSYEFIPSDIKRDLNINGVILGAEGEYFVDNTNIMQPIYVSDLRNLIGSNSYIALMRKPMMVFTMPTSEDEKEATKETLDKVYGIKALNLNNFAQALSLACWFIKDSCVSATQSYWINLDNGYNSQANRDGAISLSNGSVEEIEFTDEEVSEAIGRMYEVYRYLLPDESKMGTVQMTTSGGTTIWEVDKAISSEGNSFARALTKLQEARRTGVLPSKIDKYCSVLECIYAINKEHKKNISQITAAYIGKDATERSTIESNMRDAYGIRSDGSHGDNLKYLCDNDYEALANLSKKVDDYVRRVFRKVIADSTLNYDTTDGRKAEVRAHFRIMMQAVYPK